MLDPVPGFLRSPENLVQILGQVARSLGFRLVDLLPVSSDDLPSRLDPSHALGSRSGQHPVADSQGRAAQIDDFRLASEGSDCFLFARDLVSIPSPHQDEQGIVVGRHVENSSSSLSSSPSSVPLVLGQIVPRCQIGQRQADDSDRPVISAARCDPPIGVLECMNRRRYLRP